MFNMRMSSYDPYRSRKLQMSAVNRSIPRTPRRPLDAKLEQLLDAVDWDVIREQWSKEDEFHEGRDAIPQEG